MKQQLSSFQAAALIYSTIVPTVVLFIPSVVMTYSHQDAWVSVLAAILLGTCIVTMSSALGRKNPGLSFQAWIDSRLGRMLGVVIGLYLTIYYVNTAAVILQEFSNFLSDRFFVKTPNLVIMAIVLFVAGLAVSQGIEVIARINVIVTAITLIAYSINLGMCFSIMHFNFLQPVLANDWKRIAYGGLLPTSWLSEAAFVLLLIPYLKKPAQATKIAVAGMILAGIHLTTTVIVTIACFGSELPKLFQYPSFSLIEVLSIGEFVQRIDILFVSFWICTIYVKVSVFLFGAFHCMTNVLRIKPAKPFVWALCLMIGLSALSAYSEESTFNRLNEFESPVALLAANAVLPLLLWAGYLIWGKQKAGKE